MIAATEKEPGIAVVCPSCGARTGANADRLDCTLCGADVSLVYHERRTEIERRRAFLAERAAVAAALRPPMEDE